MATVTTNGHLRDLVCWEDVPEDQRGIFDYVEGEDRYSLRFFQYRGEWWDVSEFERIIPRGNAAPAFALQVPQESPLTGWDGAQHQSVWDAIVVRYPVDDTGEIVTDAIVAGHYVD